MMISLRVFLLGLGIQVLAWPVLYVLVLQFDRWRKRRALARGARVGHFNEWVVVGGIISILAWICRYLIEAVRFAWEG